MVGIAAAISVVAAGRDLALMAGMRGDVDSLLAGTCARSSPTNATPAAHRRRSNSPSSPACGAHRMETFFSLREDLEKGA